MLLSIYPLDTKAIQPPYEAEEGKVWVFAQATVYYE
jgi:hypothetical protein